LWGRTGPPTAARALKRRRKAGKRGRSLAGSGGGARTARAARPRAAPQEAMRRTRKLCAIMLDTLGREVMIRRPFRWGGAGPGRAVRGGGAGARAGPPAQGAWGTGRRPPGPRLTRPAAPPSPHPQDRPRRLAQPGGPGDRGQGGPEADAHDARCGGAGGGRPGRTGRAGGRPAARWLATTAEIDAHRAPGRGTPPPAAPSNPHPTLHHPPPQTWSAPRPCSPSPTPASRR
jgi:hypothetical protein